MFYVITETCRQVDESPFADRAAAEQWIKANTRGIRYSILTEAEMDEMEANLSGQEG